MKSWICFFVIITTVLSTNCSNSPGSSNLVCDQQSDDMQQQKVNFDQDLAQELAAMCLASYCNPTYIQTWNCGKPCKLYPDMTDIITLENGKIYDNHAYMGYRPSRNAIIMVFKGTLSIRNWLEDFDILPIDYNYCDKCKVHKGFYDAYYSLSKSFWDGLTQLRQKYPTATLILSGHSLGAALSTMCAADLVNRGITDFTWYNFGSPRVGNIQFAQWLYKSLKRGLFRVTHKQDPVPHAPLKDEHYHHLPQEVWYMKDSSPESAHKICDMSGEDEGCSNQQNIIVDVIDHMDYMGFNFFYHTMVCQL